VCYCGLKLKSQSVTPNVLPCSMQASETVILSTNTIRRMILLVFSDAGVWQQTLNSTIGGVEFLREPTGCHQLALQAIKHCVIFVNYGRKLIVCSDSMSCAKDVVDALCNVLTDTLCHKLTEML